MKTSYTTKNKKFNPITITITLDDREDVACWLNLVADPVEKAAFILEQGAHAVELESMENFIDNLCSEEKFAELRSLITTD